MYRKLDFFENEYSMDEYSHDKIEKIIQYIQ